MHIDAWIEILQVILRKPLRSFLAGLGVAWGIMLVILMTGASNGLRNGVQEEMARVTPNSVFIWTQGASMPYKGFRAPRSFQLNNGDMDYLRANVPEIKALAPSNQLGGWRGSNNVNRGTKTGAFQVNGEYPDLTQIRPLIMKDGRFVNWADIDQHRKVCVIGTRVQELLFEPGEDPMGQHVAINTIQFKVVGVFGTTLTGEDGLEQESTIYTPFTTFQRAFNFGDFVDWISVLGQDDVTPEQVETATVNALKLRHTIHPADQRAFGSWSMSRELEEMNLIFGGINLIALFMGVMALLAGMLVISIIMLFNVNDRIREFGVRRSLGATPSMVVWQVLKETVLLTFVAGVCGLVASVGVVELLDYLLGEGISGSFKHPEVSLELVLLCLAAMVVVGLIAGLLPALRAVAIQPVEALRSGT